MRLRVCKDRFPIPLLHAAALVGRLPGRQGRSLSCPSPFEGWAGVTSLLVNVSSRFDRSPGSFARRAVACRRKPGPVRYAGRRSSYLLDTCL